MKKLSYLIVLVLILGLLLTGCSLLANIGQAPATGQKGMPLSTADLVALWHFDENSGTTAYDSTENINDGTISGASWVDGKLGKSLSFDGNDYVMVPDSSLLEPDRITVEAWVKSSGTPGNYKYIVSKYLPTRPGSYSSYGLYTGSSSGLRFYIGYTSSWVASPDAGVGVWDGTWHHVAGTYDGSAVKLYVDGDPVAGAGSTTSGFARRRASWRYGSIDNRPAHGSPIPHGVRRPLGIPGGEWLERIAGDAAQLRFEFGLGELAG